MLLPAAALATSRIRVGTLLTPEATRAAGAHLDNLSAGRVTAAGGWTDRSGRTGRGRVRSFGDCRQRSTCGRRATRRRAGDVGAVLDGRGRRPSRPALPARNVSLQRVTVQWARPPVWVEGGWPNRPPTRRRANRGRAPVLDQAAHPRAHLPACRGAVTEPRRLPPQALHPSAPHRLRAPPRSRTQPRRAAMVRAHTRDSVCVVSTSRS